MKVRSLRKILEGLPDDMEVWQAKDPEGNGFYSTGSYAREHIDKSETYYTEELFDIEDLGGDKEVLILWP